MLCEACGEEHLVGGFCSAAEGQYPEPDEDVVDLDDDRRFAGLVPDPSGYR